MVCIEQGCPNWTRLGNSRCGRHELSVRCKTCGHRPYSPCPAGCHTQDVGGNHGPVNSAGYCAGCAPS